MLENNRAIIINRKIKILVPVAFTFIIALSFFAGTRYVNRHKQVLYISKAELLSLEKVRLEQEPLENRQLFFGKPKEAAQVLEQEQNKISKTGAIVLLTDSKIYGSNVRSISSEVHSRIIKSLSANSAVELE